MSLDDALRLYIKTCDDYTKGNTYSQESAYTVVEMAKIKIADALLEILGMPTSPEIEIVQHDPCAYPPAPLGEVYMMRNTRNGYTKIGWSKSPQFREKTLQSEEPEVKLIWSVPASKAFERVLHFEFARKRVRGEWFDLSEFDLTKLMKMAETRSA